VGCSCEGWSSRLGHWEVLGWCATAVRGCPWVIIISKRRIGWGSSCMIGSTRGQCKSWDSMCSRWPGEGDNEMSEDSAVLILLKVLETAWIVISSWSRWLVMLVWCSNRKDWQGLSRSTLQAAVIGDQSDEFNTLAGLVILPC